FSVTSVVKAPTITSFSPSRGRVGSAVTINGTNFTGVTFVYFNGTSAVFQTVSATRITAIVPSGATTGKISVVAAGGTATSGTSSRVRYPSSCCFVPRAGLLDSPGAAVDPRPGAGPVQLRLGQLDRSGARGRPRKRDRAPCPRRVGRTDHRRF